MCIPIFIAEMDISVEEIKARMHWETREYIDEKKVIPYGIYVDTSCCQADGQPLFNYLSDLR